MLKHEVYGKRFFVLQGREGESGLTPSEDGNAAGRKISPPDTHDLVLETTRVYRNPIKRR